MGKLKWQTPELIRDGGLAMKPTLARLGAVCHASHIHYGDYIINTKISREEQLERLRQFNRVALARI